MAPYLILFAYFAIGAIAVGARPVGFNRSSLLIPAAVLVIMIGLRREVGGDWWTYLNMYRYIQLSDFARGLGRTDPGYALVNWVGGQLGLGIWFVNVVCGAIFTWGLIALCRQQPNPWLALVASLYTIILIGMGYTRQSAALGFCMLALAQFSRRPNLRMMVFLALAPLFHTSSIIMALLIALASVRQRFWTAAVVAALAAFLYLQFAGHIGERLDVYTEGRGHVPAGAVPRLLMNAIPAVIFLAFRQRFSTSPDVTRLLTIFSIVAFASLAIGYMFPASAIIPDRLGFYLIPLQIVVLSRVPTAFGSGGRSNMFLTAGIIAYMFMIEVAWLTLGNRSLAWLPYRNYVWDWSPADRRPARMETRE